MQSLIRLCNQLESFGEYYAARSHDCSPTETIPAHTLWEALYGMSDQLRRDLQKAIQEEMYREEMEEEEKRRQDQMER